MQTHGQFGTFEYTILVVQLPHPSLELTAGRFGGLCSERVYYIYRVLALLFV